MAWTCYEVVDQSNWSYTTKEYYLIFFKVNKPMCASNIGLDAYHCIWNDTSVYVIWMYSSWAKTVCDLTWYTTKSHDGRTVASVISQYEISSRIDGLVYRRVSLNYLLVLTMTLLKIYHFVHSNLSPSSFLGW